MSASKPQTNQSLNRPKFLANQAGMAAFMLTLVMMLVITLIVLGFSQIARRNQREALDNRLSTQAYYAAESGVNLVQALMKTTPPDHLLKTTCPASAVPYSGSQLSDVTTEVSNSCLLVTDAPSSLQYSDINSNNTVVPIHAAGGAGNKLTLTWVPESPGGHIASCPASGQFPPSWPADCPFGVLRFDIVDTTTAAGPSLTQQSLENQTMAVFAPPTSGSQPIYKKLGTGSLVASLSSTSCSDTSCSLDITGIDLSHIYYLRVTSLYKDVALTITGGPGTVQFKDAQISVDSTGKAVDVLRRVQVRIKLNSNQSPAYAIDSSSSICKRFATTGSAGNFADPNGICLTN